MSVQGSAPEYVSFRGPATPELEAQWAFDLDGFVVCRAALAPEAAAELADIADAGVAACSSHDVSGWPEAMQKPLGALVDHRELRAQVAALCGTEWDVHRAEPKEDQRSS